MSFAIRGVPDADNRLMSLRSSEVLDWLRDGFALLDSEDPERRRDAFPPLELSPDRDLLAQLATALREAERHGLRCTKRLRNIVRERLKLATVIARETPRDLANFWRLLGGIYCSADVFAEARIFLKEVLRLQKPVPTFAETEMRSLVDAVVACVLASKPASSVQISFMRFVRAEKLLWSDRFVDAFIDCAFAELSGLRISASAADERRKQTWCTTRNALGTDLERRADPETPAGRALVRSIARYLGMPATKASVSGSASALHDRVWNIQCRSEDPVGGYGRKETLRELLDEWA